jgi:hypothetical protein
MTNDTQPARSLTASKSDSWEKDWYEITGYEFTRDSTRYLIHPDHYQRVALAWELAHQSRRFCEEYKVRSKSGEWVWVRGQVVLFGVQWIGTVEVIERGDSEHMCLRSRCKCAVLFPGVGGDVRN